MLSKDDEATNEFEAQPSTEYVPETMVYGNGGCDQANN